MHRPATSKSCRALGVSAYAVRQVVIPRRAAGQPRAKSSASSSVEEARMRDVRQIGRRTWLTRLGGGFLAVWAGLDVAGRDGWLVSIGRRATAQAQGVGASRIIPVDIQYQFPDAPEAFPISAYVVVRGREVAIVDTLLADNADRIGAAIQQAGLGWDAVRHVILTHYHFDHSGSADAIAGLASRATFWAGEADIPEITLRRPIQPAYDGEQIFGLQVVATPGHT